MDNNTLIMGLISVSIIIGIIFLFRNKKIENKSHKNENSNRRNNQKTDSKKTISNKKDDKKTSKSNTEKPPFLKEKESFKETITIKPLTEETVKKVEEEQEKENPILKIKEAKEITTESLLENVIDKIREDRYKVDEESDEESEEEKKENYKYYEELEHKVIENEDEIKVVIKEDFEEIQEEKVDEEIQSNNTYEEVVEVEETEEVKKEVVVEETIKKEVVKEFNTDLEIPFSPTIKYDEFDISVAVDELGMEEEEIEEFVIELVEQADQALEDLEKMYLSTKFNFEEMEKITHKIKGSATSLRVKGLADVITEFNTYLKNDEEDIKIETIRIYIKDTKYYLEKLKEILF